MMIRTVLMPINNEYDVTVMQYSLDGEKFVTMPLVSSYEISQDERDEIMGVLDLNEKVAESYTTRRFDAMRKPTVVETSGVEEVVGEEAAD